MGSSALGMLFSIGFFITLISLSIVPQYSEGKTRHYEFNVCNSNNICLPVDFMFSIYFMFLKSFVDQDAKCNAFVPHKEHGDCKWKISWTSSRGKGGGPSSYKSHEPRCQQHLHPLV